MVMTLAAARALVLGTAQSRASVLGTPQPRTQQFASMRTLSAGGGGDGLPGVRPQAAGDGEDPNTSPFDTSGGFSGNIINEQQQFDEQGNVIPTGADVGGDGEQANPPSVPPGFVEDPDTPGFYWNDRLRHGGYLADPYGTGDPLDAKWVNNTPAEDKAYVNGGGSGGSGGSGVGAGNLAQRQTEFTYKQEQDALARERQQGIDERTAAQNAATGAEQRRGNDWNIVQAAQQGRISIADALAKLAELRHQEQQDPFKFGQYLQHLAALPAGTGNPVQSMVSSGVRIEPNTGPYDSIEAILRKVLDEYNQIPSFPNAERARSGLENPDTADAAQRFLSQRPEDLKRMFGGGGGGAYGFDSPEAAQDFAGQIKGATPEQLSALEKMAQQAQPHEHGGGMTTAGPALLVDLSSGKPLGLMGEAGPERLTVTPLQHTTMHTMDSAPGMSAAKHAHPAAESTPEGALAAMAGGVPAFAGGGYMTIGGISGNSGRGIGGFINDNRRAWAEEAARDQARGNTDLAMREQRNADPYSTNQRGGGAEVQTGGNLPVGQYKPVEEGNAQGGTSMPGGGQRPADQVTGITPSGDNSGQTPSEQARTLGAALRPMGFAPPELLDYLDRGEQPPPGTVTDRFMSMLPPAMRLLLQAVIKAFGTSTPEDYEASRRQFRTPGITLQQAAGSR